MNKDFETLKKADEENAELKEKAADFNPSEEPISDEELEKVAGGRKFSMYLID